MNQALKASLSKKWAQKNKVGNAPPVTIKMAQPAKSRPADFIDPRDPQIFFVSRRKAGATHEWEFVHREKFCHNLT